MSKVEDKGWTVNAVYAKYMTKMAGNLRACVDLEIEMLDTYLDGARVSKRT
jgi:hypothetical protein